MSDATTAISLFQFAIETLGRIQLARQFQDDFGTYQLKLDIIQLRLSRWGQIAGISSIDSTDKNVNETQQIDKDHGCSLISIKEILGSIQDRLHKAQREAKRVKTMMNYQDDDALDPDSCMPVDLKKIRIKFKDFCRKRKAQASKAFEGIKWIFYARENFDKFAADMSELIDGLEKMIPENDLEKFRQLSDEECKGISKSSLEELKDIIEGCDPWLESSVDKNLNISGAGTFINQSHNTGNTVGIHNGDNKGITYGDNNQQQNTFH